MQKLSKLRPFKLFTYTQRKFAYSSFIFFGELSLSKQRTNTQLSKNLLKLFLYQVSIRLGCNYGSYCRTKIHYVLEFSKLVVVQFGKVSLKRNRGSCDCLLTNLPPNLPFPCLFSYLESCELCHHGLVVEEPFQAPLGDFGLVRGVLGRPSGVLEDVSHDGVRDAAVVVAHADVRAPYLVFFSYRPYPVDQFVLA